MSLYDLTVQTRSCRRFENKRLPEGFLKSLVELARVCPSARNAQPLKFITLEQEDNRERLFEHLRWAGALKDWDGPAADERPAGYFIILLDKTISANAALDTGIVAQTIQLAAMEQGIGSCMIGAYIKDEVERLLDLPDTLESILIIALGYPGEERRIVDVKDGINYFRDEAGIHYVPKRSAEDLLVKKM